MAFGSAGKGLSGLNFAVMDVPFRIVFLFCFVYECVCVLFLFYLIYLTGCSVPDCLFLLHFCLDVLFLFRFTYLFVFVLLCGII